MTLEEIHEGMPVLYIPRHAQGKGTHPDCQRGIVTGKTATHVLVRHGTDQHSNPTRLPGARRLRGTRPRVVSPPARPQPWGRAHHRAGGGRGGGLLDETPLALAHTRPLRSSHTTRDDRAEEHRYGRVQW